MYVIVKSRLLTTYQLKLLSRTYFTSVVNHESFLSGSTANYMDEMYRLWSADPKQVHASWDVYFRNVVAGQQAGAAYVSPPSLSSTVGPGAAAPPPAAPRSVHTSTAAAAPSGGSGEQANEELIKEYLTLQRLIASFRMRGHRAATLDPLNIVRGEHLKRELIQKHVLRDHYKLPHDDKAKMYLLHDTDYISGNDKYIPLDEIIKRLENAYCGNIGIEYMHVTDQEKLEFIRSKFEPPGILKMSKEEKQLILKRLSRAHRFEEFLSKKFPSEKRFGLEGGEVMIPAVKTLVDAASAMGVDVFNIGIAHRGRLNLLANVLRKSLGDIFAQFKAVQFEEIGSGDVKYHLGTQVTRNNSQTKRPITISLMANPSHLECVNPIACGKTHADREARNDTEGEKVWSILIHGDAATCGQGVVYETFHLSELPCFTNHGSVHIIVNNQIGFTTDPRMARSSEYCTEVAKVSSAPVFHVNGDDPEATCYVMKVAAEYKQKFKSDVVVDIWCYRRHGHSEADQPKFTQPIMYKVIDQLKPVGILYSEKLVAEGIVTQEEIESIRAYTFDWLTKGFEDAEKISGSKKIDWLDSVWHNFFTPDKDPLAVPATGAKKEVLLKIGHALSTAPENFDMHPQLLRLLKQRKQMIEKSSIDWALAEALAIGSLTQEGHNVRLTGQDTERGTFSQRHHVYHDQSRDKVTYEPLLTPFPEGGRYTVCNSSLSEFGVLGFQLGHSQVDPNNLVMWEAQFGDFANSAQIIIDQFIASGEAKWGRQTSLVLLLPHGLEGQGPEHSSARPERFLTMCAEPEPLVDHWPQQLADANWFLVNATTPANYFHALRRQLKLNFRKPMVVFTPKYALRHPASRSPLEDMIDNTMFKPYIKDHTITDHSKVERVLVSTGKIFYELQEEREKRGVAGKVALCRVEQLFPFPYADLREDLKQYSNAQICWAQEEHKNHGWWEFVQPRLSSILGKDIHYLGRPPSAPPSTGNRIQHAKEVELLLNQCFS